MSAIPYPYLLLKLLYVRLLSLKMEVFDGEMCQSVSPNFYFIKLLKATKWQSVLCKNVAI